MDPNFGVPLFRINVDNYFLFLGPFGIKAIKYETIYLSLIYLFNSIYIFSCIYCMNAVAKEISFNFFFHQDFDSNGRQQDHR